MKKTEKAFMLSVLVFPGSGHLMLKRYLIGSLLIIIAAIASYYLVYGSISQALEIAEKITSGEISPDLTAVFELVTHQTQSSEFESVNTAFNVLLMTWLVGIADTFRISWRQARATKIDR